MKQVQQKGMGNEDGLQELVCAEDQQKHTKGHHCKKNGKETWPLLLQRPKSITTGIYMNNWTHTQKKTSESAHQAN